MIDLVGGEDRHEGPAHDHGQRSHGETRGDDLASVMSGRFPVRIHDHGPLDRLDRLDHFVPEQGSRDRLDRLGPERGYRRIIIGEKWIIVVDPVRTAEYARSARLGMITHDADLSRGESTE